MYKKEGPILKGEDVKGWRRSADRHFQVNKVANTDLLECAITGLEGALLHWFIWTDKLCTIKEWHDFKVQIGKHFNEALDDDIMLPFLNIYH